MSKTIGIFCAGQNGDCMTISSVLKYREELWGKDCKIVWYISDDNKDLLKHQDIEVRTFPRGYGYPEMVIEENKKLVEQGKEPIWEDWLPLVDENNHLNIELAKNAPSLAEFDIGYFPAPHQVAHRNRIDLDYPNVSRKVFGIPDHYEWHPTIIVSKQEEAEMSRWLPPYHAIHSKKNPTELIQKPTIAIESFCGSGQSIMNEQMIKTIMQVCRDLYGECYFIFMSHKFLNGNEPFPEWLLNDKEVYFARKFTVRQCAYLVACCQLLVSVSSGISVAASCWQYKENPTPIIQFCGSFICSTKSLATGRFELITADLKKFENAQEDFFNKLCELIESIKK